MLSSFVSRELGYGYAVSDDLLQAVNTIRETQSYSDIDAAEKENGTSQKKNLGSSPFVCEFEYGSNNNGYWTYDQMIIQLEDIIDVLKFTHPHFDFLFIFDHSNRHECLRPNGLNLTKSI